MNTLDALYTRRSIRSYKLDKVSDEDIESILKAAMYAPSAGNQQPWYFIVLNARELLDQIPSVHPHSKMITQAPMAILVCADLSLEKHKDFWVQDCAAATQNLLLAAHAKGLGAVWLGVYPREDRVKGLQQLLNIPKQVIPLSLIPIGYPAEEKSQPNRYNPERIFINQWDKRS